MNKTAKEMFEELGYEYFIKHETYMLYEKSVYDECYEKCADGCYCDEDGYEVEPEITYNIEFDFNNKTVLKTENDDEVSGIETEELKAINKQIEELGWECD